MKIFWDTNILIDLLTFARSNHKTALTLLAFHIKNKLYIHLTPLTLANAEYVLTAHHDVFDFEKRFKALDYHVNICDMNQAQANLALNSGWKDFEDALQYQSAIAAGCSIIITRDHKGFSQSIIPIYSPEQFLEEHPHAT